MNQPPQPMPKPTLPVADRFAYALPAFALAVVGIPVYVHLPKFYTDVVGVSVGTIGTLILLARLFDAVTDPLVGLLSDRTRSRFGRRRPYIALFCLPLALSLVALFAPPGDPGAAALWFGVFLGATFLFWTLVMVPYESLGPELTFDFHERTGILGLRDGFLLLGTLLAAAAPALVGWLLSSPDTPAGERTRFLTMAWSYAPLLLATCWWCAVRLRELPGARRPGARPAMGVMVQNRPFVILLASYTVAALGSNLPAALILYYVEYVLESNWADLFLAEYLLTGIVMLPAWIALSRRMGKKQTWIFSMLVNTGAFVGVFFLGPGDEMAFAALVLLSGLGLGATLALPSSLQADVIDYDELLSGQRREGRYVGVWSISRKAAAALGVGVALPALGMAGYVPNQAQTPEVLLTLRVLYALFPCVCNLAAIAIAARYPIGQTQQQAIRTAIDIRKRGDSVADPLRPHVILGAWT